MTCTAMRCVKGVGPNDVTLFISRRPQVRMRICLCRLFKVVKSSSGTGSVDTANNQMEESHAVISLLPLRFHEYLVAQT